MWRDIEKLTGNGSFRPIAQLKTNTAYTSDPSLMAEIFAKHYTSLSSNYKDSFLSHKTQTEKSQYD